MLKNYLNVSFRNLSGHKGFSIINIMGLAVGMACCILILLWVQEELSYDRFHRNANDLYWLVEELQWTDGKTELYGVAPAKLAPALKKEFPEILETARFLPGRRLLVSGNTKKFYEERIAMADPSFLMMFTFPLTRGDTKTALLNPNAILLTEKMARKYFGREDPMGKYLVLAGSEVFQVTGVLEDIPANSHLQLDFLVPFFPGRQIGIPDSEVKLYYTYIQLHPKTSLQEINRKIKNCFEKIAYTPVPVKLSLQPLTRIHLYSQFNLDMKGHGSITNVIIFSIIAGLVLLLACINFMNLATALYSKRTKEVSLRKVLGAKRREIVKQLYGEALFMSFIAGFAAVILTEIFLPLFNEVSGKKLTLDFTGNIYISLGLLGILLLTSLISGSYPAWVLSAFQPALGLKGTLSLARSTRLRRILVVTQFSISILLLVSTVVVFRQLHFMRNNKPGFDKEHVVVVPIKDNLRQKLGPLKNELKSSPGITNLTAISQLPTNITRQTDHLDWPGKNKDEFILMNLIGVDYSTLETFGFEIIAGRFFSETFPGDQTGCFVVNEAAVKALRMEKPVGKPFQVWSTKGKIIGVIKDFHFRSLHHAIAPLIMRIQPDWAN